MDERLTKALTHANYKATLVQQRENLKLRFANTCLYAHNGGVFTITPTLLSMVDLLIRQHQSDAVLIDDKNIPVKIPNLETFLEDVMSIYAEASNEYHVAWETLRKARSVEAAISK